MVELYQRIIDIAYKYKASHLGSYFSSVGIIDKIFTKKDNDDIFIFYLDLDGMKSINDTLGHEFGDKALIDTSNIMHKTFRTTDILSRIGGDEFVVVVVKAQHEFIPIIIQRLKEYVAEMNSSNKKYNLSISIGVSKVDLNNESPLDDAIQDADKEMYRVKVKKQKNKK